MKGKLTPSVAAKSETSESLAFTEAETTYSKAAKAELERDWDQAFKLYLKAAEGFLHISRITADAKARTTSKAAAGKSLERAEKIKSAKPGLAPVAADVFSEQQQFYVLNKSSLVNGLQIPLWNERFDDFGSVSYQDPDGQPQLSAEQLRASPLWQRPLDVIPNMIMTSPSLLPHDIVQLIVDDCSVSASLSVCLEHHIRFGSKLGISSLYPRDQNHLPKPSPGGKYALRVLINGTYRRIVIDDRLPFHQDRTTPMCLSTGSKRELWPSLIEKAYIKLMGGYCFPGSNSCIDLHALTGWIPEHIEIKSPTFEREKIWTRIIQGFSRGHCVLTVGTAENADIDWKGIKFLAAHCQGVVDVREVEGERWFTILDSKVHGDRPRTRSVSSSSDEAEARILNIPWDDVYDIFEGIYISWDPALFDNQLVFHGVWKPKNTTDGDGGESSHRRLRLNVQTPLESTSDVWVLLTRHIVDTRRGSEFISLRVDDQDYMADVVPKVTTVASNGRYTSSPHFLVRTQISRSTGIMSVIASYEGPFEDVGFTVTAYSSASLSWDQRLIKPPFTTKVTGTLTNKNAGGNPTHPTYMTNPQYHLQIHPEKHSAPGLRADKKAHVSMTLHGPRESPLNATVVWSQGERVTELSQKEIAANSGAYSYGVARVVRKLPVGNYTVILSAYEPHHTGPFSLSIESTHRFDLKSLPQEGAGMYSKAIRGTWDAQTAAGGPSFKRYNQNPAFEMNVTSPTKVIIRLQLTRPSPATFLNVTLFPVPSSQTASLGRHIATSGPYSDAISGTATSQIILAAGKYLIVPSTYHPGVEVAFRLLIYSTTVVGITPRKGPV